MAAELRSSSPRDWKSSLALLLILAGGLALLLLVVSSAESNSASSTSHGHISSGSIQGARRIRFPSQRRFCRFGQDLSIIKKDGEQAVKPKDSTARGSIAVLNAGRLMNRRSVSGSRRYSLNLLPRRHAPPLRC